MRLDALILYIKIIAYFLIPILLFLLPSNYFDNGRELCLSKILLDESCPACGITRASMRFIHFEFKEAMEFNPLVIVVFPLLAFIWLFWLYKDFKKLSLLRSKA